MALGNLFRFGDGVRRDFTEAAKWYRKAAEQGNDNAHVILDMMYEAGEIANAHQK